MSVEVVSTYWPEAGPLWLKGNLHTHTTRSDGTSMPQDMVAHYAKLGYDFLMLSDHDTVAELSGLDAHGMVLIVGNEICGAGRHQLHVDARTLIQQDANQQAVLDEIARAGGLAILCHPNWTEDFNHYPFEAMRQLTGYAGIEVFNGVCVDLAGNHLAVDKWDRLLSLGKRVWGFANDDAHRTDGAGRGWNVVQVRERSAQAVVEALREGRFYASSGVTVNRVWSEGPVLRVQTADAQRLAAWGHLGARLYACDGPELSFDVSEVDGPYIRVECYGRGGDTAWLQPMSIRGGLHERMQENIRRLQDVSKATAGVLRSPRGPELTGRLDDPLWREAPAFDRFFRVKDAESSSARTQLQFILADGVLHIGGFCQEPHLDRLKAPVQRDGDAGIWSHDSVEIFFDTAAAGEGAYHLMVSANGHYYMAARGAATPLKDASAIRIRSSQGGADDQCGWRFELALPLAAVGLPVPAPGQAWGFHACRNRHPVKETLMATFVGKSNHNWPAYGRLAF